ncbi:MAG: CRISPR-associated endonuclease Cas2 [Thermoguttaceae bacterium]|jgi:CRISPR-associated protein Cas2|nr:CRISPR-associated endonuclease Cas2 [Thermoguttaceae bacterium]MDI9445194.1 CRISPR-associated endonuclease Cas2 [Planctomycetota bacterium]
MWLFAMFDLPVGTKAERKRYAKFRKMLVEDGFSMLQFSVYARYCVDEESALAHRRQVRSAIPPEGYVRLLSITDRQFGKMENFVGKKPVPAQKAPQQLSLF